LISNWFCFEQNFVYDCISELLCFNWFLLILFWTKFYLWLYFRIALFQFIFVDFVLNKILSVIAVQKYFVSIDCFWLVLNKILFVTAVLNCLISIGFLLILFWTKFCLWLHFRIALFQLIFLDFALNKILFMIAFQNCLVSIDFCWFYFEQNSGYDCILELLCFNWFLLILFWTKFCLWLHFRITLFQLIFVDFVLNKILFVTAFQNCFVSIDLSWFCFK
jgi:hypothetical protein